MSRYPMDERIKENFAINGQLYCKAEMTICSYQKPTENDCRTIEIGSLGGDWGALTPTKHNARIELDKQDLGLQYAGWASHDDGINVSIVQKKGDVLLATASNNELSLKNSVQAYTSVKNLNIKIKASRQKDGVVVDHFVHSTAAVCQLR